MEEYFCKHFRNSDENLKFLDSNFHVNQFTTKIMYAPVVSIFLEVYCLWIAVSDLEVCEIPFLEVHSNICDMHLAPLKSSKACNHAA